MRTGFRGTLATPLAAGLATLAVLAAVWPHPTMAHVIVLPSESEAGGYERYAVVVPTEGDSPTVGVEVKLPMGMEVMAVESKPGWEANYDPFPIGAATVTWKGGRIPPGQMLTFDFLAWNPPAPRALSWVATQSYEDGSKDQWGGEGSRDHAAAVTMLKAAAPGSPRSRKRHAHGPAGAAVEGAPAGATGNVPGRATSGATGPGAARSPISQGLRTPAPGGGAAGAP